MPTWLTQGSHRYYREADLMLWEIRGVFTLEDTMAMYALSETIEKEHGYTLTAFDARAAGGMAPGTRRYVGDKLRTHEIRGATVIIGASFPTRTMITFIQQAAGLIGRSMGPTMFCATVEEGLQWIASERPRFVRQDDPPK